MRTEFPTGGRLFEGWSAHHLNSRSIDDLFGTRLRLFLIKSVVFGAIYSSGLALFFCIDVTSRGNCCHLVERRRPHILRHHGALVPSSVLSDDLKSDSPSLQSEYRIFPWTALGDHEGNWRMTQNPKTDTEEIRGKLGRNSERGDEDDAQERSHGRADRSGVAAGGSGSTGGGGLSESRHQRGDVLSLEAAVFW